MKLSKWDIAEGLGLEYNGLQGIGEDYVHVFTLGKKLIKVGAWYDKEDAEKYAAEDLFEKFITFLGG